MSWKRPSNGSRMNREVHVRFWESPEEKVLRATRQNPSPNVVRGGDGCSPESGRRLATRSACVEAMLVILTSKDNDHAGQRNRNRTKARRLEQGQTDRSQAAAA